MKKSTSTIFLLIFLIKGFIPSLDLCCELQRIPNLMGHFDDHKSCNDDSFINFLLKEYITSEVDAPGHHSDAEHENLPFKGSQHSCQLPVFLKSDSLFSLEKQEFKLLNAYGFLSHIYVLEIIDFYFEPPKA